MFISSKDTETPSSSKTNHENDEQEKETNRQGDDGNDEDIELLINYSEKVATNFPCQGPFNTTEMVRDDNCLCNKQKYKASTHASTTAQRNKASYANVCEVFCSDSGRGPLSHNAV